jgi:SAM-dependent methyltransferase
VLKWKRRLARETYLDRCREVSPMRGVSTGYALAYRLGFTPWERYGGAAAASIGALLDREEAERPRPLGRAIDLGCGRGQYTPELARRGWETVGIDNIPRAIDAANRRGVSGPTFVVGDVTDLAPADLGTFDFFFDVGCFQHLNSEQRLAEGRGVSALANPGATLLMLEFQAIRVRSVVGGVTRAEVEAAFSDWEMLSVEPAETKGLGWPLTKTRPQWYRLRLRA